MLMFIGREKERLVTFLQATISRKQTNEHFQSIRLTIIHICLNYFLHSLHA